MDLESIFTSPKRKWNFNYELRRYLKTSRIDNNPDFRDGSFPIDFRSYLILNHTQNKGADDFSARAIPELVDIFNRSIKETSSYFRLGK